jgi:hypothetical protein
MLRLYATAANRLDFLCPCSHLLISAAYLPALDFGRSTMTMLHSHQDRIRDRTGGDAYRSYLVSRSPTPIVTHSGKMHLRRLRVLVRKVRNHLSAAFAFIHKGITAAKMRRIQRELTFHTGSPEWSQYGPKWQEDGLKDIRDFPQAPLLLGDKWDS